MRVFSGRGKPKTAGNAQSVPALAVAPQYSGGFRNNFIQKLCKWGGLPPFCAGPDANYDHRFPVWRGQGQDIANMHLGVGLGHTLAVYAHMSPCCQLRAGRAAAAKAGMEQPQVQSLGGWHCRGRGLFHGGQERLKRVARAAKGLSGRVARADVTGGGLPALRRGARVVLSFRFSPVRGWNRIMRGAGGP